MTGGSLDYSVTLAASATDIDAALWEACFVPPLEGRWWYETLEYSGLEDQFSFLYGVIRRNGEPVGIAPAFLMNFPVSLVAPPALQPVVRWLGRVAATLAFPRTLFVGSPCADEGTVGLAADVDRRAAMLALQKFLAAEAGKRGAVLLVWKDVPPSAAADLDWLAAREGLFRVTSYPGTLVELGGPGKAGYFAALKGSRRHVLRKKIRRSAERADLAVEIVRFPDEATLDELFGLFLQTYEKATTRFERLNRKFFALIAAQPATSFVVLKERPSGRAVAFMLCFELGSRVINKFIGIDYQRPKEWLLYFRLWDAALDFALARGARSIQSGQTGYAPKIETGHRLVALTNYCRHRNPLIHAVARLCARHIDWAALDDDLARHIKAHPQAPP